MNNILPPFSMSSGMPPNMELIFCDIIPLWLNQGMKATRGRRTERVKTSPKDADNLVYVCSDNVDSTEVLLVS